MPYIKFEMCFSELDLFENICKIHFNSNMLPKYLFLKKNPLYFMLFFLNLKLRSTGKVFKNHKALV